MTVMLRKPRLSDGPSWRETNLRYERRLAPAFAHQEMSWPEAHSPYMWVHTWRQALADTARGWVSYLLVHLDSGQERVAGHLVMAGRHPRTGGTEVSTWTAGVPHSVTMWAQTALIIAGFEADPHVPHAVAPLAVQNVAVHRLAQAVGWSRLQTCRRLRIFDGAPSDHEIWFQANSAENLAALRGKRDALSNGAPERVRAGRPAIPWSQLLACGHYELRNRLRRATPNANSTVSVDISGRPAGVIEISVDPGSSTTELIVRAHADAPEDAFTPDLVKLAARVRAAPAPTRRVVVAARADDLVLIEALAAAGFQGEGPTLPTYGESGITRHLWTYLTAD